MKNSKNTKNIENIGRGKGGWENPCLPDPWSDSKLRIIPTLTPSLYYYTDCIKLLTNWYYSNVQRVCSGQTSRYLKQI